MFNGVKIVIPSRSRYNSQKTVQALSQDLWTNIVVVVPSDQYISYRQNTPMDIGVIPFDGPAGVAIKRDFILKMHKSGKVIMMDDDLRFYKRSEDGKKFAIASPLDTELMVEQIVEFLTNYPMVGLVDKFMSQHTKRGYEECRRFNQVLGFNRDLFPDPWPTFRVPHDEEHDIHLQFLTRGYKTAVLTEWSKVDKPNAAGGCSDWRNKTFLENFHKHLESLWPGIVSITPNPPRARYNWKEAQRIGGLLS
jgi:hypothetical protein